MKIAIQGHPTRGKEVIQILKNLGGENTERLTGCYETFYYINDKNKIGDAHKKYFPSTYKFYTLEEFEKEFPFKVGDEVTIVGFPDFPKVITKMAWDCDEILYSFEDLNNTWFSAKALKKFEMKEERNITLTLDKAKEWYKKGGELKEIALQAFTEKELNPLPRSWEEFCENYPIQDHEAFINYANGNITICKECAGSGLGVWKRKPEKDRCKCVSQKSAEAHLAMIQLEQLRNCWWNGWEPDWNNKQTKYCIVCYKGEFKISILCETRHFLSFPTMKMAEEFLKCFRDLIEKAGDLI